MKTLVFISGNASKVREIQQHVSHVQFDVVALDLQEIQSLDLIEVATRKAQDAYARLQRPLVVEDTSLVFHALGSLPGPLIKLFLRAIPLDGLCQLAHAFGDPRATASVAFAYHDRQQAHVFVGSTEGTIPPQPRGAISFGWDPIFVPAGETRTWSEMGPEAKRRFSMRRKALEKLEAFVVALPVT
jgi:non-canonical purine NTP pyrophosphatase (RdgB/HAM1 family)